MENITITINSEKKTAIIGKLLKKARQQKGISQNFVATKMNQAPNNISKLENGGSIPTVATILRYCKAINVQVILA